MGAIAGVELRRFLRDRSNIFFVFVFPLLLVMVIGLQFGGGATEGRVAVAGDRSALRTALVTALENGDVTVTSGSDGAVRELVARGRTDVAVLVTDAAAAAFAAGDDVALDVIRGSQPSALATFERLRAAAGAVIAERGQVAALAGAGLGEARARAAVAEAGGALSPPTLAVVSTDDVAREFTGLGRFDLGATGQTLLFVFLASVAGSATLIHARRLGVIGRTLAAPVSARQAIAGQAAGRFAIAAFQGGYIMVAAAVLFGVDWGDIRLSLLVLAAFSAVAAGAAMVLGSLLDNDSAASGAGVGIGLVLAALGGCMLPLELFPDTLRTVAHVTPHAWAYEAFAEIQRHDAGLGDIVPQLVVLGAMAGALLVLGTWALRRSVARPL